jgi:hypothetical protein
MGSQRARKRPAPVFYDCEASCVGGMPIEIGWAFANPESGDITSESYLINPPPSWNLGPVWDPDAARLHKISKEDLYAHGRRPIEIAERMNEALRGRELYSDHPLDDRLAEASRLIIDGHVKDGLERLQTLLSQIDPVQNKDAYWRTATTLIEFLSQTENHAEAGRIINILASTKIPQTQPAYCYFPIRRVDTENPEPF